jgi:hypothetical protein
MIPENQKLKKQINFNIAKHIILHPNSYFEFADEFVKLQLIFVKESAIEIASLWLDMVISPLASLIYCLVYRISPSIFTILSLQKTLQLWSDWFRFKYLTSEIREWTKIVRSIGGPFISTNDPLYHIYVYADAMQRLNTCLFMQHPRQAFRRSD